MKVAIIGTAGRGPSPAEPWDFASDAVRQICDGVTSEPLELGSGGAAWSDALAPRMFLEGRAVRLHLFLPAEFGLLTRRYRERGPRSPGAISNYYHQKAGGAGLDDLAEAIRHPGCHYTTPARPTHTARDFFARNADVAQWADSVVAITFGGGHGVADGGTLHTVRMFLARPGKTHVVHIDLSTREVYVASPKRIGAPA